MCRTSCSIESGEARRRLGRASRPLRALGQRVTLVFDFGERQRACYGVIGAVTLGSMDFLRHNWTLVDFFHEILDDAVPQMDASPATEA